MAAMGQSGSQFSYLGRRMSKQIQSWTTFAVMFTILGLAAVLRLSSLRLLPLYWEEVALGYDAYSLALTGADHHGNPWPVVALESFGDWKPAGYVYVLLPFIKVFGLQDWVVRLPSALAGIVLVWAIGQITGILVPKNWSGRTKAMWLAMGLTAVSPWALQFARAAWEVNVATTFFTVALWQALLGYQQLQTQKESGSGLPKFLILTRWLFAAILVVFAVYTYHAYRLFAPMFVGLLGLYWWWRTSKKRQLVLTALLPTLVVVLGLLPMLLQLQSSQISQRWQETSWMADPELLRESATNLELSQHSLVSRVVYFRGWYYVRAFVLHYFDHLNLGFLFIQGDTNIRHSLIWFGILFHLDALAILGLAWWLRRSCFDKTWTDFWVVLGLWLVVAIVPAALTTATPHALRILPALPASMVLLAVGWMAVSGWLSSFGSTFWVKSIVIGLIIGYLGEVLVSQVIIWKVYPRQAALAWQVGYPEMIQAVQVLQQQHPDLPVVISRFYGRPAMYYWFYTKANPSSVQAAMATAPLDQGEALGYENISFPRSVSQPSRATIVAAPVAEFALATQSASASATTTIFDRTQQPVWQVGIIE